MTPTEVLVACAEAGVSLSFEAGELRYRGPVGAYGPELRAAVAENRAALIALLSQALGVPTSVEGSADKVIRLFVVPLPETVLAELRRLGARTWVQTLEDGRRHVVIDRDIPPPLLRAVAEVHSELVELLEAEVPATERPA
jgi:hypothetical protein